MHMAEPIIVPSLKHKLNQIMTIAAENYQKQIQKSINVKNCNLEIKQIKET